MSTLKRYQIIPSLRTSGVVGDRRSPSTALTLRGRCCLNWIEISLAALLVVLGMLSVGRTASAESPLVSLLGAGAVYLPMVSNSAVAVANQTCELNAQEQELTRLMAEDPNQERDQMSCNPVLARAARERAKDMATRGYFDHVNPDGYGPNHMVLEAGFRLPDWYDHSDRANNVESIGGGFKDANAMWQAWLGSQYHRVHVLGTVSFYADQEEIGMGYYEDKNSPYGTYWVLISAPKE